MQDSIHHILGALGGQKRVNYALDSIRAALESVGNPERAVKSLVVAGTNGKGSTTLLLSSGLKEAGFKVASYLSPHLCHPQERFLNGMWPIARRDLERLTETYRPTAEKFGLTYFEYLTLLFFIWSRELGSDFNILEVGLGGRLDATNVTTPLAVALPSVSLDHQAWLGSDLLGILREKLAVVPEEGLLFSGVSQPELRREVEVFCDSKDAIYYHADELRVEPVQEDWRGQTVQINSTPFYLAAPGAGIRRNASTALLLLRILFPRHPLATWQRGFARVRYPGRWETLSLHPRIILSGDHNPAGLEATAEWVRAQAEERLYVVCGFSPDKPAPEMIAQLKKASDGIWLTHWEDANPAYAPLGNFEPDPMKAVDLALAQCRPEDTLWITGSLYLAGHLRPRWRKEVDFEISPTGAARQFFQDQGLTNRALAQTAATTQIPAPLDVSGGPPHPPIPSSDSHTI